MSEQPTGRGNRKPRRRGPLGSQQPTVDVPEGYLAVGRIINAHGIRGELSVELYTDFPEERFAPGQTVLVGAEMEGVEVITARPHKGRWLLRFEEVNDRDEAEALQGTWLYIPEEAAATLDADEYFVHQILGLTVQNEDHTTLGTVQDVLFTGANEVYIVQPAEGINKGRDLLIPAIGDVVQDVDLESGVITVRLLPGILEE